MITNTVKDFVTRSLSIGLHQGLSEGKKFALRVSVLDGYWTIIAIVFYIIYSYQLNQFPLFYVHVSAFFLILTGLLLMHFRFYDISRVLMHLTGLIESFLAADGVGERSGYEFFFFTQILIPHITWSLDEKWWKGASLSVISCALLFFQEIMGTGLLMDKIAVPHSDRQIAIGFVIFYTISTLVVARWKLTFAQKRITEQQEELIHSSSLVALGEMAGGIAHEINNPLQSLNLQLRVLEERIRDAGNENPETSRHLIIMNETIQKMGKMVQGLKDLSRKDLVILEEFPFTTIMDDVLAVSNDRLTKYEIRFSLHGDSSVIVIGHPVQFSQVFINLMNNSIDAIKLLSDKWITIDLVEEHEFLRIEITDSGRGIPQDVARAMMRPFFTTKLPSKGTGLGLSISQSILEKNGGKLIYEADSPNTKFVIRVPFKP